MFVVPLFQENSLKVRLPPLVWTRNGPSSCAAPVAIAEQPGPVQTSQ